MNLMETIAYLFRPLRNREFWMFMSANDIRYKYKRTLLGPFWLMFTNAIYIAMLSFVFGALFKNDDPLYVPWVASGVLLWNSIGSVLRESATVFYDKRGFLMQTGAFQAPQLIYWVIWRNVLVFAHQLPIVAVVLVFFHALPSVQSVLMLIPGLFLFLMALLPVSLSIALMTARLRDLEPLIATILMALFFVTPIMWYPDMLGDKAWLAYYNPMTYLLELIRNPLLGLPVSVTGYAVSGGVAAFFWLFTIALYQRFANRLAFWV